MNFPVFSQLARKLGFRDEFAPDCLLQQRVMRTRDLKADRGLLPPKSLVTDKLRSLRKWRHWGRLRSLCHQYAARARRAQSCQ